MEMAEIRRNKVACFQKMRNDTIKKSDTMAEAASKVNA
jgi:hypothetical protein